MATENMFKVPQNINNRHYYLDKVKPFIGQNILKVFKGQRRVGKSYFLFQLIHFLQNDNTKKVLDFFVSVLQLDPLFFRTLACGPQAQHEYGRMTVLGVLQNTHHKKSLISSSGNCYNI